MNTVYQMGVTAGDQANVGGDSNANAWLGSADDDDQLTGRGKNWAVALEFAVGGTLSNPTWGTPIPLGVGDTKFAGAWLEAAIDAGFVNSNNDRIVLIKSFYQNGDGQFEAKIAAQDYADDWAHLS